MRYHPPLPPRARVFKIRCNIYSAYIWTGQGHARHMSVDAGSSQQRGVEFRGREVAACPCTGFLKMTVHPVILPHIHTRTAIHMQPCACYAINPNSYPSVTSRDTFRMPVSSFFFFLSQRTGGRAGEGEERGVDAGGRSQKTPTLKGHPLSAAHSVAARPR